MMIKVLINSRAQNGIDKYRISQPHHLPQELFPDESIYLKKLL